MNDSEYLPHKGYVRKRSKYVPTGSSFYLATQLVKCMMRFNERVGHVRTKMINTKNMNNSEMSTLSIPNFLIYSLEKSKSEGINAYRRLSHIYYTDEGKSKRVIVNACSSDESESKGINRSINKNKVEYARNKTKEEESLVTDISCINAII